MINEAFVDIHAALPDAYLILIGLGSEEDKT